MFLHDIRTGEEVSINADVSYSAMSTLKLAVVEEVYRKSSLPLLSATGRLISETLTLGVLESNVSANSLLEILGDGDADKGVRTVNESLQTLGLHSSFLAAPFGERPATAAHSAARASKQGGPDAHPDPYFQTTPRDMGLLLEMLVECSQGGGPLLAAYAGQMTTEKCQAALRYLALNDINDLATKNIPAGTRLVHKHAYSAETHADVAAIWGPAGPYVLSIYLYSAELARAAHLVQDDAGPVRGSLELLPDDWRREIRSARRGKPNARRLPDGWAEGLRRGGRGSLPGRRLC